MENGGGCPRATVPAGFKMTEVGAIPEDWEVRPLVALASIRTGIAKNSNVTVSNPVQVHYLRVANVQDGFLDLSEMSQIRINRADIERYAVLPGDVLMNEGGDLDKLGRGAIWRGEFSPCVHQNHVFVVRCGANLSPGYLNFWTSGLHARRYFMLAGRQTTNLASISKTSLGQLPVALPSTKSEQEAIAETLNDADALVESLEQLIAKKRLIKQGAMQELLTGKKRLPGFAGKWRVKRLGDVAEITMGQSPSSAYYNNKGDGLPLIQGNADIFDRRTIKRVFTTEITKRGRCGDILMSVRAPVGEISRAIFDVCLGRGVCAIRSNIFLYHALIANEPAWAKLSKGSTFDSVNSTDVKAFEIQMPTDEDEQTAIATILSDMDAELSVLECKLAKARQIKQGMMQELLTGRRRLV